MTAAGLAEEEAKAQADKYAQELKTGYELMVVNDEGRMEEERPRYGQQEFL